MAAPFSNSEFFATAKFLGHKLQGTLPPNATVIIAFVREREFRNVHKALLIEDKSFCFNKIHKRNICLCVKKSLCYKYNAVLENFFFYIYL